jgi:hypothetical protein
MLHFSDLLTSQVYRIVEKEALKTTEMWSICDEELLERDEWATYRISALNSSMYMPLRARWMPEYGHVLFIMQAVVTGRAIDM